MEKIGSNLTHEVKDIKKKLIERVAKIILKQSPEGTEYDKIRKKTKG